MASRETFDLWLKCEVVMVRALRVCPGKNLFLFCCPIVLGLAGSVHADPKALTKDEQAKVDKAINKGVAYLKRIQREKGDWPLFVRKGGGHVLGETLLPAYALLESGVPANDPAIKKAAEYIRPRVLKLERTYDISLAILFLDRLGDPKDKKSIQSLALRLIASQHRTGGWSYRCLALPERNEAALLQSLEKLSNYIKEGGKLNRESLRSLEVPRALGSLTVFQEPEKRVWIEQENSSPNWKESLSFAHPTDNSNTQFAMLGMWVAQRYGVPMEPSFRVMVERFERTQVANGYWPYSFDSKGDANWVKRTPSMLCVGLLGLAIGRGLKLPTPGISQPAQVDPRILKGLAALSQDIGSTGDGSSDPHAIRGGYYLWSVERVAMLYDLSIIGDKDWYKWGAGILLSAQKPSGEWRVVVVSRKELEEDWGPGVETSFALLFLKHSHPMSELTTKLPIKGKELNKGVVEFLTGAPAPQHSVTTPSRSGKPKR